MPEWVKWIFDGLGTAIISLIIGSVSGGIVGYHIGKRRSRIIQSQKAGSCSEQFQEGKSTSVTDSDIGEKVDVKTVCRQTQKAGDHSKQTQIGG